MLLNLDLSNLCKWKGESTERCSPVVGARLSEGRTRWTHKEYSNPTDQNSFSLGPAHGRNTNWTAISSKPAGNSCKFSNSNNTRVRNTTNLLWFYCSHWKTPGPIWGRCGMTATDWPWDPSAAHSSSLPLKVAMVTLVMYLCPRNPL